MLPLQGSGSAVPGRAPGRAQAAGDCGATSRVEIASPERPQRRLCCSEASKSLSRDGTTSVGHQTSAKAGKRLKEVEEIASTGGWQIGKAALKGAQRSRSRLR